MEGCKEEDRKQRGGTAERPDPFAAAEGQTHAARFSLCIVQHAVCCRVALCCRGLIAPLLVEGKDRDGFEGRTPLLLLAILLGIAEAHEPNSYKLSASHLTTGMALTVILILARRRSIEALHNHCLTIYELVASRKANQRPRTDGAMARWER